MNQIAQHGVTLPGRWPLRTQEPIRIAQIRVMLNTIVTDALSAWRRAPQRTWSDISRLVLKQMMTLDRLYPEAGILDTPLRQMAVQFFATNADARIGGFARIRGEAPSASVSRLVSALRSAEPADVSSAASTRALGEILCNKPLAAAGLTSYRCRGRFGWVMIGATDDDDAFREALRSCPAAKRETLQVWGGTCYEDVATTTPSAGHEPL